MGPKCEDENLYDKFFERNGVFIKPLPDDFGVVAVLIVVVVAAVATGSVGEAAVLLEETSVVVQERALRIVVAVRFASFGQV
jgi:hypothetical protein